MNIRRSIKSLLVPAAIVSFLSGGIIVLVLSYFVGFGQFGLGSAFLLAPIAYLYSMYFHQSSVPKVGRKTYKAGSIAFFVLFAASILVYLQEPYERSLVYFFLVTGTFCCIFVDVAYVDRSRIVTAVSLAKILAASLALRAGRFFAMETIPGSDLQVHSRLAVIITEIGHVPSLSIYSSKYVYSPIWHLSVSIGKIISAKELAPVLFLFVVLPFTLVTICSAYSVGTRVARDSRVGLISAILISVADMYVVRGVTSITPSSYVICYVSIILVLAFIYGSTSFRSPALILFLLLVSLFTHQLASFALLVIISSMFLGDKIFEILSRNNLSSQNTISLATLLIFGAATYVHWNITSQGSSTFFTNIVLRSTRAFRGVSSSDSGNYAAELAEYDAWSNILYNAGYSLLILLAVVGILHWLRSENLNPRRSPLIMATAVLFFMIYPLTLVGFDQVLLPHRQIVYLEFLLAIFAGFSTIHLLETRPSMVYQLAIVLIAGLTIFALITTPFVNRNNPVYAEERVERTGMTNSEVSSLHWSFEYGDATSPVATDPYFTRREIITELHRAGYLRDKYYGDTPDPTGRIQTYGRVSDRDAHRYVLYRNYIAEKDRLLLSGTFGSGHAIAIDNFESELWKGNSIYSNGKSNIYALGG